MDDAGYGDQDGSELGFILHPLRFRIHNLTGDGAQLQAVAQRQDHRTVASMHVHPAMVVVKVSGKIFGQGELGNACVVDFQQVFSQIHWIRHFYQKSPGRFLRGDILRVCKSYG